MTAKMLLEQYMAERHALGFVSKTDEGCIRRFLRDYKEPEDGKIVFSKEYVLEHIGTGLNQKANTVLRDVSAINGFLKRFYRIQNSAQVYAQRSAQFQGLYIY